MDTENSLNPRGGNAAMGRHAAAHAARHALLVVDDEKFVRLTVGAKLRAAGYAVVTAATVDEAVAAIKSQPGGFTAVVSDIMMGDMDGFMFRDIVRGMDSGMPFFFMTALDPEEGSGFLKQILCDPMSYYLPKSAGTDILIRRMQRVVASRRIENFIEQQTQAADRSLAIAAQIQRSMLPPRMRMDRKLFYTTLWRPNERVSGDLYEAMPFGSDCWLFVLGDIQGHGVSAALTMMSVQSLLKNLRRDEGSETMRPHEIANMMQNFFIANFADVTYMTALICVYLVEENTVEWISCGAPDPAIETSASDAPPPAANPENRGGVPIGLLRDTVYDAGQTVTTVLPPQGIFCAATDGIFELSRGPEQNVIPMELIAERRRELVPDSRAKGEILAEPYKQMESYGDYRNSSDDITMLMFGPRARKPHIFECVSAILPFAADNTARAIGEWCAGRGLSATDSGKVQVVFEETIANLYDHGFDDRRRMRETVAVRLLTSERDAQLTIWDFGEPVPSLKVAAGSAATQFALKNQEMSNHGRGRLIVRELCNGIERKRYGEINETVYHIKLHDDAGNAGPEKGA